MTISSSILLTIFGYLGLMIVIGFCFRSKKLSEYFLANRTLNSLQTAMGVAAADTSAWVMIALPAAVYSYGLSQALIPIGLIIGSYLSWTIIGPKLREKTAELDVFTIPSYLEKISSSESESALDSKLKKVNSKIIIRLSSIITLFFLVIYIASGFKSAAILLTSFTELSYLKSLYIITIFIFVYTLISGINGISWGDVFQSMLIILTLVIIPFSMYRDCNQKELIDMNLSGFDTIVQDIFSTSWLTIISSLSWGLGYFGEPHILSKFISAESSKTIYKARKICIPWTFIAFLSAILIGFYGCRLWTIDDSEKLFFFAIFEYYNQYVVGIFFSAIVAAILSTISSQMIVCSGILIENVMKNFCITNFLKNIISVSIIIIPAFMISMSENSKIMDIVGYAWAGLASSFGPIILYSLYKKVSGNQVFLSILMGCIGVVLCGYGKWLGVVYNELYEIIPGFIFAFIGIFSGKFIGKFKNTMRKF
jgi:sodium/proline symporter